MRIPFLGIAAGFALGIIAERLVRVPAVWILGCLGAGLMALLFLRGTKFFLPVFILMMSCAGILCSRLDAAVLVRAVQRFVSTERLVLTGRVSSLPEMKTRGKRVSVSLVLDARSISRPGKGYHGKVPVTGRVQVFLIQPSLFPQVGDDLRLFGSLETPRQVLNPGEFDYGRFLGEKNIYAIFQTIGPRSVKRLREGQWFLPGRLLAEARRKLAALIDKLYAVPEAAIMKALVLGLRSDVASGVRDQFMKTGTIHLLAISGLNITMIAGSFYLLFILCGLGYRWTAAVTLVIVVIYMGLAGFGLPVQRAGYVAVLALLGTLWGRTANLLNAMCVAFFFLLLWNPKSLWNIGFQLSFLSVFSLILILPLLNRFNVWSLSLGSSLAVLAGTFPLVLYYFNTFSPIGIVANLLAIPIFDAALFTALFTLLFSGIPFLNIACVKISSLFLWLGLGWVKLLAGWPWGYWFFIKPSLVQIACYYGSLAGLLFLRRGTSRRDRIGMAGFAVCWFALTISFFWHTDPGIFQLTVLSSGRNQIAHVRFSNQAHWLINAGRSFPSDQGEWLVAPFLRWQGIRKLEGILVTDLSKKHTGGLPAVLRNFPIRYFLYPGSGGTFRGDFLKGLRPFRRSAKNVRAGDKIVMGHEFAEVIAESRSGMAVRVSSGPWRVLTISKMDPVLFNFLLMRKDPEDVHAVILLPGGKGVPPGFYEWMRSRRPLLLVLPDADRALEAYGASLGISCLDLKHTGALTFRKNGEQLDIDSFLRGKIGSLSYF